MVGGEFSPCVHQQASPLLIAGEAVPSPVISALVRRGSESGLRDWWRERQGDRKRRASSNPALDRNRPAMGMDDPLDDGEPKPAPPPPASPPPPPPSPLAPLQHIPH